MLAEYCGSIAILWEYCSMLGASKSLFSKIMATHFKMSDSGLRGTVPASAPTFFLQGP